MSNTHRPSAPVKHTVIEEGSEFKGSLTSSCPIDVRGRIEGEVATPALTVSKSGSVHGRAKVGAVRSEGELSGEFDAETIELAGSVRDNTVIRTRSLEVKLAADRGKLQVIFGECELSVGDEPTEHDRVEVPVVAAANEGIAAAPPAEPAAPVVPAEATMVDLPAVAKPEAADATDGDDEEEDGDVAQAADGAPGAGGGKKRRKKKTDVAAEEGAEMRWSHPPSQPPPAN